MLELQLIRWLSFSGIKQNQVTLFGKVALLGPHRFHNCFTIVRIVGEPWSVIKSLCMIVGTRVPDSSYSWFAPWLLARCFGKLLRSLPNILADLSTTNTVTRLLTHMWCACFLFQHKPFQCNEYLDGFDRGKSLQFPSLLSNTLRRQIYAWWLVLPSEEFLLRVFFESLWELWLSFFF